MRPQRITLANADTVGTVSEVIYPSWQISDFHLGMHLINGSGADAQVQFTLQEPGDALDMTGATWASVDTLVAGSTVYDFTTPCTGVRVSLGATAVDAVTLDIVQSG